MNKIVWVSSWDRVCGIADYSKVLVPEIRRAAASGFSLEIVSLDQFKTEDEIIHEIRRIGPALVHFQHEYGFYGGKNPPVYYFPRMIDRLRKELPKTTVVATGHTVLSRSYRFPVRGRGWQTPVRWLANLLLLPALRNVWQERTWGGLDAGIVHSALQVKTLRDSGCAQVRVIPHYVPAGENEYTSRTNGARQKILVFGFVTPEKGQDIVIEALARLPSTISLTIAGAVRRNEDHIYYEHLLRRIEQLGLKERVEITGFIPAEKLSDHYRDADLVVTPFRETSGSGSIAHALARGLPILASDLPINVELETRTPGCIFFFKSQDVQDCADKIRHLLSHSELRSELSRKALEYAHRHTPAAIAAQHIDFYRELIGKP